MECLLVAELIRPCRLCLVEPFIQYKLWLYRPTTKEGKPSNREVKANPENWNAYWLLGAFGLAPFVPRGTFDISNYAAPYRRAVQKGDEVLKGRPSFQ